MIERLHTKFENTKKEDDYMKCMVGILLKFVRNKKASRLILHHLTLRQIHCRYNIHIKRKTSSILVNFAKTKKNGNF